MLEAIRVFPQIIYETLIIHRFYDDRMPVMTGSTVRTIYNRFQYVGDILPV